MIRSHHVLILLTLCACAGGKTADRAAADTVIAFTSLAAPAPTDSTLRILVSSDASAYADGKATTLRALDSLLTALKLINGEVWYYRAPRDPQLADRQDSLAEAILTAITRHDLPVRIAKRADFSDQEGKHRRIGEPGRP